jgi:hypothetical protein
MNQINRRTTASIETPGSVYLDCRLCWRRIKLAADRVEIVHWEIVYRCPHCDSTFLIRQQDASTLGVLSTESHA